MEEKIWLVRILSRPRSAQRPRGCEDFRAETDEVADPEQHCAECTHPKAEHRQDVVVEHRWKGKANGPTQAIIVAAMANNVAQELITETQAIEADGGEWVP